MKIINLSKEEFKSVCNAYKENYFTNEFIESENYRIKIENNFISINDNWFSSSFMSFGKYLLEEINKESAE